MEVIYAADWESAWPGRGQKGRAQAAEVVITDR